MLTLMIYRYFYVLLCFKLTKVDVTALIKYCMVPKSLAQLGNYPGASLPVRTIDKNGLNIPVDCSLKQSKLQLCLRRPQKSTMNVRVSFNCEF